MLLRRIKIHVETENWFAVFIDFCIVVLGVFLGIQIGNWNESLRADAQETLILTRLLDETAIASRYYDHIITGYDQSNEARFDAIEALQTEAWRDMDETRLIYGIGSTMVLPTPSPRRSALDELMDSGFYSSLDNERLRTALDDYVASLRFLIGQTDYIRAEASGVTEFDGYTLTLDRDTSRQTGVTVDFEMLKAEPMFFETVIQGHNSIMAMTGWWRGTHYALFELCEAVSAHLDKPCEANSPNHENDTE